MSNANNMAKKEQQYEPLRLIAQDAQDLDIILSLLQDSLMPVVSIVHDKKNKALSILTNRFCWEVPEEKKHDPIYYRVHAGLMFKNIEAIHEKNIDQSDRSRILSFLTAYIDEHADHVFLYLMFSDNACIRVTISKIHCTLADIDEPWSTRARPEHLSTKNNESLTL
jgi:hypothetical protein